MEGIVAKRSLKKSYYDGKKNNVNLEKINNINKSNKESKKTVKTKFEDYKSKVLFKMSLQSITVISFLIFVIGIKYFNITVVKEADITKKIIKAYNTNYSIMDIKNESKNILKKTYSFIKPVIPNIIKENLKNAYNNISKKNNNKSEVTIYEETSSNNKEDKKELADLNELKESVGTSSENEQKVVTVSSSISSEVTIAQKIKNTKINFVKPLNGIITSHFGAREVIFKGVDSYHTGTDIATNSGEDIVSSIDGKVTAASYNKYNGNFVEVTNGKIVTKYLHMSKITVKKGVNIKAGQKIGEVGSTGLATGPHLHFEIVYDGTKVDPELILSL